MGSGTGSVESMEIMNNNKQETIVVTGANGFLGLALCKKLLEYEKYVIAVVRENADITVFQDMSKRHNFRICYCDMKDYRNLEQRIKEDSVDVIYHLAWSGTSGELRGDYNVQNNNYLYSCDLLMTAKRMNCRMFVFASSIMEFEVKKAMEMKLSIPCSSVYSMMKGVTADMLACLAAIHKIGFIKLIISNVYGPGEYSERLINTSIRKMINGEHCAYTEGTQMYDFIYISDAVEAFVRAAFNGNENETYYIGSLNPKPLREYLLKVQQIVCPAEPIALGEIDFTGVSLDYQEFDIQKLNRDTGFEPQIDFEEGIYDTMNWIKEMNHGTDSL